MIAFDSVKSIVLSAPTAAALILTENYLFNEGEL